MPIESMLLKNLLCGIIVATILIGGILGIDKIKHFRGE